MPNNASSALTRLLREPSGSPVEKECLDEFLLQHASRYDFSLDESCGTVFRLLVERRFLARGWACDPRDYRLRVLQCMRVLMRDPAHREHFVRLNGVTSLIGVFAELAGEHLSDRVDAEFTSEMLVETLSILKRFATLPPPPPPPQPPPQPPALAVALPADEQTLHRTLVLLLSTREALVLQCALVAMYQFAQVDAHMHAVGQLGCAEVLLRILMDYEHSFKVLAAEVLELLLANRTFFQEVVLLHDGTSTLLSLLHADDPALPVPLLRALERLARDVDSAKQIRTLGGINVILSLLSDDRRAAAPSRDGGRSDGIGSVDGVVGDSGDGGPSAAGVNGAPAVNGGAAVGGGSGGAALPPALVAGVCSVLTALALEDDAAHQIRKANGVYILGRLLIADAAHASLSLGGVCLAAHIFRTLRFVFATERNRKVFRRIFPPDLFASFIDVGHYERSLDVYVPLAQQLRHLAPEDAAQVRSALEDINVIKGPACRYVGAYAVQELLGKGAFGRVFQVKKDSGETLYAMKELPIDEVAAYGGGGLGSDDGGAAGGDAGAGLPDVLRREVSILSTVSHPHIIKYYESFTHGRAVYIVMELVEGATLLDHLNSLAEKGWAMPEERVWRLFSQLCLALRYIHKERHVVHRDLTPSNIMLSAEGVIKLADFGLAKQRHGTQSILESVVGTVLYQCPEIIQHEAYGEKADIWALGCVLYQMAALSPPFSGANPLAVARSIVEGDFTPLPDTFSPLLSTTVARLLTVDPDARPDILEVAALISPLLLTELDRLAKAEAGLRDEVRIEREWRQRHEKEASSNREAVHRLFARQRLDASLSARGGLVSRGIGGGDSGRNIATEPHRAHDVSSPLAHSKRAHSREPRSPMLSISPNRIREIHDPCSRILNQLHKILFIAQLPPSMEGEASAHRQVIERYKRALFSHRNHYRGWSLKDELHKVLSGSQEVINLTFAAPADGGKPTRLSYEQLQHAIELVLSQTGYYAAHFQEEPGLEPNDVGGAPPAVNGPAGLLPAAR